jgi:anti-anti-sigma factor
MEIGEAMLTDMQISIDRTDGDAQVELAGRLDVLAAPGLRRALGAELEQGVRHFDLDFQGVDFIDSAGIAAVVSLITRCRRAGGSVTLHGPVAPVVHRIFDLTGFAKVFDTQSWDVAEM